MASATLPYIQRSDVFSCIINFIVAHSSQLHPTNIVPLGKRLISLLLEIQPKDIVKRSKQLFHALGRFLDHSPWNWFYFATNIIIAAVEAVFVLLWLIF